MVNELKNIVLVALGGAIGASLRHLTNELVALYASTNWFFTATAIENILGSFLMGFFFIIIVGEKIKHPKLNLFLLVGLLGSYTTYSGFSVEAVLLLDESVLRFLLYVGGQVISGIVALIIGIKAATIIQK